MKSIKYFSLLAWLHNKWQVFISGMKKNPRERKIKTEHITLMWIRGIILVVNEILYAAIKFGRSDLSLVSPSEVNYLVGAPFAPTQFFRSSLSCRPSYLFNYAEIFSLCFLPMPLKSFVRLFDTHCKRNYFQHSNWFQRFH